MMLPIDVVLNLSKKEQEFVLKVYTFMANLILGFMVQLTIFTAFFFLTLPFILF